MNVSFQNNIQNLAGLSTTQSQASAFQASGQSGSFGSGMGGFSSVLQPSTSLTGMLGMSLNILGSTVSMLQGLLGRLGGGQIFGGASSSNGLGSLFGSGSQSSVVLPQRPSVGASESSSGFLSNILNGIKDFLNPSKIFSSIFDKVTSGGLGSILSSVFGGGLGGIASSLLGGLTNPLKSVGGFIKNLF